MDACSEQRIAARDVHQRVGLCQEGTGRCLEVPLALPAQVILGHFSDAEIGAGDAEAVDSVAEPNADAAAEQAEADLAELVKLAYELNHSSVFSLLKRARKYRDRMLAHMPEGDDSVVRLG